MPLKKLPYLRLEPLIQRHLSTCEEPSAVALTRELRSARGRGYLTKRELEAICYWKSARAIRYVQANSPAQVRNATKRAFSTRSERARLEALCTLSGVSVPMASAILTLLNPRRYGVIDIRVWQLLHSLGTVAKARSGVGFSFSNWYQFLMIIRHFAKRHKVKARDIERTLFMVHQKFQKGRLYQSSDQTTAD